MLFLPSDALELDAVETQNAATTKNKFRWKSIDNRTETGCQIFPHYIFTAFTDSNGRVIAVALLTILEWIQV